MDLENNQSSVYITQHLPVASGIASITICLVIEDFLSRGDHMIISRTARVVRNCNIFIPYNVQSEQR